MKRRLIGTVLSAGLCALTAGLAVASPAEAQDPRDVWLDLLAAGKIEEGRDQLVTYAGGLPPVEATRILRWVEAISMTEGADQTVVAEAIVLAQRAKPADAMAVLAAQVGERTDEAAPLLIALAIQVAHNANDTVSANTLRAQLVSDFADHPVTPEALLDLAEHQLAVGAPLAGTTDAVEALIVAQPTHPLVPTARRMLARLKEASGAS